MTIRVLAAFLAFSSLALPATAIEPLCVEELRHRTDSAVTITDTSASELALDASQWRQLVALEGDATETDETIEFMSRNIEAGAARPVLFMVQMAYEVHGQSAQALCTFRASTSDRGTATIHTIRLNGWSRTDWLAARAAELATK